MSIKLFKFDKILDLGLKRGEVLEYTNFDYTISMDVGGSTDITMVIDANGYYNYIDANGNTINVQLYQPEPVQDINGIDTTLTLTQIQQETLLKMINDEIVKISDALKFTDDVMDRVAL